MKRLVYAAIVLFLLVSVLWLLRTPQEPAAAESKTPDTNSVPGAATTAASSAVRPTESAGRSPSVSADDHVTAGPSTPAPSSGKEDFHLPPPTGSASDPLDVVRRYGSGAGWSGDGGSFEVLKLRAVRRDEYSPELGPALFERNGRVVFAAENGDALDGRSLPVVARASNGVLGFLSGVLLVTLNDRSDVDPVARTHGLELKAYDEDLRLATLRVPEGTSILQMMKTLQSDPSVADVKPEVIQSFKRF